MPPTRKIWVDHTNPVLRLGIVKCLREACHTIAGVSAGLWPEPDLERAGVLLFEINDTGLRRATNLVRGRDVRLVGLLSEQCPERVADLQHAGVCAVLGTMVLTPSRLIAAVEAAERPGPSAARPRARTLVVPSPHRGGRFTPREIDVLRLLAEGASTRDIAERMNYSERTVKNIVHGLLVKLRGRTRAQAVAVAARRGVI
jgi:DNA-binding NarL/FixJ family response regulator